MSDVKERDPILWLGDATPDADVWELTRWPGVMILGGPTILYLKADPPVAVPAGWWICDDNGRPFAASRPVRAARAESEGTPWLTKRKARRLIAEGAKRAAALELKLRATFDEPSEEGTRLDGTIYTRCPLCHAECAPASRDGQGETPTNSSSEEN